LPCIKNQINPATHKKPLATSAPACVVGNFVNIVTDATCTRRCTQGHLKIFCFMHPEGVREYNYINFRLHEHIHGYTVSRSRRLYINYAMRRDYSSPSRSGSTSTMSCVVTTRTRLHRLYCAYAVHSDAPSRHSTSCQSVALALTVCPVIPLCVVTTLSRGRNRYTSSTPHVRVSRHLARHIAQLVTRLVAPLVIDYFTYAARLGASARHVARHVARSRLLRLAQARHRLLHLCRASGCLGTSRGSSVGSSSTTSPRAGSYAACPGA
jgi:hypothetical protein